MLIIPAIYDWRLSRCEEAYLETTRRRGASPKGTSVVMGSLLEEFLRQECPEVWAKYLSFARERRLVVEFSSDSPASLAAASPPSPVPSAPAIVSPSATIETPVASTSAAAIEPNAPSAQSISAPFRAVVPDSQLDGGSDMEVETTPANNVNADGFTVVKSRKKGKKRPATDSDLESEAARKRGRQTVPPRRPPKRQPRLPSRNRHSPPSEKSSHRRQL
ncbi:unnamed protein product, partial [Iphiclides podalirius]